MIDFEHIDKVREYIESGKLEEDFADGSQNKKYKILEFLEALMDTAELADDLLQWRFLSGVADIGHVHDRSVGRG